MEINPGSFQAFRPNGRAAWLVLSLIAGAAVAQAERDAIPTHSDPVVQAAQDQINALAALHRRRLEGLSGADAAARDASRLRRRFAQLLGLQLNGPRTAPKARAVGRIVGAGYRIEKVMLDTEAGVSIPCNIYVPTGGPARKPTLLVPHGHSGRDREVYQNGYQRLARAGFLVLAKDGWGKQERRFTGHGAEGGQLSLVGRSLMALELWDDIRCVDYLLSRPDVSASHLGMTGISGGGSQTLYAAALDERIRAASPVCAVTSFQADLADTGMCVCEMAPGLLQVGDHGSFLAATFPRPVLVVNGIRDPSFPIAGARDSARLAAGVYARGGLPNGVQLAEYEAGHDWNDSMLDRQIDWFREQWGLPAGPKPPADGFRAIRSLQLTPNGAAPTGKTLHSLTRAGMGGALKSTAERSRFVAWVGSQVRRLAPDPAAGGGEVRRGEWTANRSRIYETRELSWPSGLGGLVRAVVTRPLPLPSGSVPFVLNLDRDRQPPQMERLWWDDRVRANAVTVDLQYTGKRLAPAVEGQVGSALVVAGRSLLAERVRDIRSAVQIVEREAPAPRSGWVVVARGFDAAPALMAYPSLPRGTRLVLADASLTYRQGAVINFTTPDLEAPPIHWSILPGIASRGDLLDLLLHVPAPLRLVLAPRDSGGTPLSGADVKAIPGAIPAGAGPGPLLRAFDTLLFHQDKPDR